MKKFYFFLHNLLDTLVTIVNVLLFSSFKSARNIKKLNAKRDRPVSILANGPSLNRVIIDKRSILDGTDKVVVNFFANTFAFREIKPEYYLLIDPNLFNDSFIESKPPCQQLIENLNKVDWKLFLIVPHEALKKVKSMINNENILVIDINCTRIVGLPFVNRLFYKHGFGVPNSKNVIIPGIISMMLLGYESIYLYGVEFSWTKTMDVDPSNGKMFFNDGHFYEKSKIRYFDKGGYLRWLKSIVTMIEGTNELAILAKRNNVRIVNRTTSSFVDAFEFENID